LPLIHKTLKVKIRGQYKCVTVGEPDKGVIFNINTDFGDMRVMALLLAPNNNYLIKWYGRIHWNVWLEDVGRGSPRQNRKPPPLSHTSPQRTAPCYPAFPNPDTHHSYIPPTRLLAVPPQSKPRHVLKSQPNKLTHPQDDN
jgi:hypothetical protein